MIKPQQFIALAAVTAAAVIFAVALQASTNRWSQGKVEGALLLPNLPARINTVETVEITQGDRKVTLERAGEAWKVKERAGYPANADRVHAFVRQLAQSQLVDQKTATKDRYKLLELEDPKGKDAKSRGVRLLDQKGGVLADVILGKSRFDAFGSGRGGVYVRRDGETQTWLATGDPKGGADIKDWVSVTAFETETGKIAKLTLEHPGEEPLVIEKGDDKEKFKLAQMPEGKKLKQGVTVEQIASGFGSIEFEDVRKADTSPTGGSTLKLEGEGGLIVTFHLRKDGDANWLSLSATSEGDAKKRADEINASASGWEYKIPQWKADQIGKRRADLFETS